MDEASRRIAKRRAKDRLTEQRRYDENAHIEQQQASSLDDLPVGYADLPRQYHRPYRVFQARLDQVIGPKTTILELGAGTGRYTRLLSERSREVVALDISHASLEVCRRKTGGAAKMLCADIEHLPLRDQVFDLVCSAGALSYGSPEAVVEELRRVLRPGGSLLVVDSLNHNPIYRFNRWLRYRRGQRSLSTLHHMPTLDTITLLSRDFDEVTLDLSGSLLFLHPVLERSFGARRALNLSARLDEFAGGGRYAFKFTLLARGFSGYEYVQGKE